MRVYMRMHTTSELGLGRKQNQDKSDDYFTDIKEKWRGKTATEIKEIKENKRHTLQTARVILLLAMCIWIWILQIVCIPGYDSTDQMHICQ